MTLKEVGLWVIEKDKLVKIPFAQLDVDAPCYQIDFVTELEHLQPLNVNFDSHDLIDSYFSAIVKVHDLLYETAEDNQNISDLYDTLTKAGLAFAGEDAYKTKRKKKKKVNETTETSVAYYNRQEGLVLRLDQTLTLENIHGSMIHELGHHVDYSLDPDRYNKRSAIMREVIAIFIQETLKISKNYKEDTDHYQAQQLLKRLENSKLPSRDFKQQLGFFTWIHHEIVLEKILKDLIDE